MANRRSPGNERHRRLGGADARAEVRGVHGVGVAEVRVDLSGTEVHELGATEGCEGVTRRAPAELLQRLLLHN